MKLALKITGILLIFALLTACVAATENKNLPTKEEITDFIAGIPVSDNYIITVFDTVKDKQPTWNCDTWEDKNGNQMLSLYYIDPDSVKGYDSIYFNEFGKKISMCGVEAKLVNHYVGEAVSEENTPVGTTRGSIKEQSVTDQTETVEEEADSVEQETESAEENPDSVDDKRLEDYEDRMDDYEDQLAEYKDKLAEYESQSVKYNQPTAYKDAPAEEPEASSASVSLHGEKTKVLMGEDILLRLSAVNLITKPTMHVQAIIIPPSGMSVSSTEFVESGAGQYTTTYDIEPGKGRDIEVRIAANQVGDFNVTGRVIYYFGSDTKDGDDTTLDLPIRVEDPTPSKSTSEENPSAIKNIPGFGAVSLVMILIMVFLLKRD